MHLLSLLPCQIKRHNYLFHPDTHTSIHTYTHTHTIKRRDNSQQRSCILRECEAVWRNGPWHGRVEEAEAWCFRACWMRSGLLSSTESKKSSGISGLRHQWGTGGLAELFSPGPYLPTFSGQVLPFPHPCRRWKVSFLKRLSHRYGSRIPGDGKTGTFTENRNWENFQTYRQPTGMWKDARHL